MKDYGDQDPYNEKPSQAPVVMTAEDARQQYQNSLRRNTDQLSNLHVETGKDGESYLLGVRIPKNLKPIFELAIANTIPFLIDKSDNIYHGARRLSGRLGVKNATTAATIGAVVENTFRWGIIGAKPIFDIVHAGNKNVQARKELFDTFSPIMHATGANIRANEVMRNAFDELHTDWMSDMKALAADLPTLVPMAILGMQDQAAAKEKRTHAEHSGNKLGDLAEKLKAKQVAVQEQINANRVIQEETNAFLAKYKEDYIREGEAKKAKGFVLDRNTNEEMEVILNRAQLAAQFERDIAPEIRYSMREQRSYRDENQHEKLRDLEDKSKADNMLRWAVPVTSGLSQVLKANIDDSAEKRRHSLKAWKMIEHLRHEMDAQCERKAGGEYDCDRTRSAEDITIGGMGDKEQQTQSLKEFIIDVFQQHERDRQPDRSWRDAKGNLIDPLGASLVTRLMPAVDQIAEHIADGRLDAGALYVLVGENKIINHHHGGARNFVNERDVARTLSDLVPVLGTREMVKLEEFSAKFADPALIQDTLRKNLQSMEGSQKALFASLFPDDILEQAGMKKAEVLAARKQAHDKLYDFVAAAVVHQAARAPEELKKLGLSETEIQTMSDLADKINAGDIDALKTAVDGRDKSAIDAVRTAGLLEQAVGGAGEQYWTQRVRESAAVHKKMAEAAATPPERETASRAGGDGASEEKPSGRDYSERYGAGDDMSLDHPSVDEKTREFAESATPRRKGKSFANRVEAEDRDLMRGARA